MKALISPNEAPIYYISGWGPGKPPKPIWTAYPNSCRLCQVEPDDQIFPVADPLFWTDCADDVVADMWYYDTATKQIFEIAPEPPFPLKEAAPDQPSTTGTTTI